MYNIYRNIWLILPLLLDVCISMQWLTIMGLPHNLVRYKKFVFLIFCRIAALGNKQNQPINLPVVIKKRAQQQQRKTMTLSVLCIDDTMTMYFFHAAYAYTIWWRFMNRFGCLCSSVCCHALWQTLLHLYVCGQMIFPNTKAIIYRFTLNTIHLALVFVALPWFSPILRLPSLSCSFLFNYCRTPTCRYL